MLCLKTLLSRYSITFFGGLKNLQNTLGLVIWPSLEFLLYNKIPNTVFARVISVPAYFVNPNF